MNKNKIKVLTRIEVRNYESFFKTKTKWNLTVNLNDNENNLSWSVTLDDCPHIDLVKELIEDFKASFNKLYYEQ